MWWLLKKVLFGHVHSWETMSERQLKTTYGETGSRYICRCKDCGWIRKFDCI